ncbi:hypothetical protein FHS43_000779 [Streptosporangium becharense]|uniref:CU044_5270 family protein n=1 Tax=Streptosporangium becharense TaxID=1816182 RepID=A0A7W9IF02_9ACTN|nr:CU044_5270 family protein [Streptosporangium becharense]MBB2909533.1 hypothetical protein [Streptosporangium becharense]MBB5819510.1 hypothetical protein [Streptosporangium becharense]
MDEFKLIDEVMPDVPPPAPGRVAEARARVLRTRRRGFPAWAGIALAAAATAAVIGAIVVVPALRDGAGNGPAVTAVVPADGRAVFDAATDRLARRRETEHANWRREVEHARREPFEHRNRGKGGFTVDSRIREVLWAGPDGRTAHEVTALRSTPLTAADRTAWKKAGSPGLCGNDGDCDNDQVPYGYTQYLSSAGSPEDYTVSDVRLSAREVRELPRDPAELKAELLSRWAVVRDANDKTHYSGPFPSDDDKIWQIGQELLVNAPTTPGTRAAILRMLAALPGARVVDGARDVEGRTGLAVLRRTSDGSTERQVLVDRVTGDTLAVQEVLVVPHAHVPDVPVGSVFNATLVRRIGWTDDRFVLPEGCTPAGRQCLREAAD